MVTAMYLLTIVLSAKQQTRLWGRFLIKVERSDELSSSLVKTVSSDIYIYIYI